MRVLNTADCFSVSGGEGCSADSSCNSSGYGDGYGGGYGSFGGGYGGGDSASLGCNLVGVGFGALFSRFGPLVGGTAGVLAQQACENLTAQTTNFNDGFNFDFSGMSLSNMGWSFC